MVHTRAVVEARAAMSAIEVLVGRIAHMRRSLELDERKLAALRAFVGFADETTAMERIEVLLGENLGMAFTAAEIIEACRLSEAAGRKALARALKAGLIWRVCRGNYCAPTCGVVP